MRLFPCRYLLVLGLLKYSDGKDAGRWKLGFHLGPWTLMIVKASESHTQWIWRGEDKEQWKGEERMSKCMSCGSEN